MRIKYSCGSNFGSKEYVNKMVMQDSNEVEAYVKTYNTTMLSTAS